MPQAKLTTATIAKLPVPVTGRTYFADRDMPNLALCVTANDCRTFYRTGRVNGKPAFLRIGAWPAVSIADARKACQVLSGRIARGENPADDKRQAVTEAEPTLAEAFAVWYANYAIYHRKEHLADKRRFERLCRPLAGLKLTAIGQNAVAALFLDVARDNGPFAANRVLWLIRAVYGHAKVSDPCTGIKKFKAQSRDRYLLDSELRPFFAALDAEPVDFREFFSLLLFCGVRRGNLQSAKWEEFSLADCFWRSPKTKNGKPVIMHLSPPAVAILSRRKAAAQGEFVFPAKIQRGCIKSDWKRIVTRAGLVNFRPHDLRRSLATIMAAAGDSDRVIAKMLGHSNLATVGIYAQVQMKPVAAALDSAASVILAAAQETVT